MGVKTGPNFCVILHCMRVTLAHIGAHGASGEAYDEPIQTYLKRCAPFMSCTSEVFRSEKALFDWLGRHRGRTQPVVLLLDGKGKQMSSEELAGWLKKHRDGGAQQLIIAVGPADGWTNEARAEGLRRGGLLSLGPMTLAHSLALLVIAEQLYRACTILTGHPYHRG